jgi:hypothetical protein
MYIKLFLKDLTVIFIGSILLKHIKVVCFYGIKYADKFKLSIFEGMLSGIICYLIFTLSIRLTKSAKLFAILSILTLVFDFFSNMHGAKSISLSQRVSGWDLYVHGDITLFGAFYYLISPIAIMAAYALFLLIADIRKSKIVTNHQADKTR